MEVNIWGGPKFQLLKTACGQLERLNAFLSFRHTTGESKLTNVSKKSDISAINPGKWSLKLNNTIQPSRTVSGNRETQGRRNERQRWVKLASLNKINTISSKCYICRKETLEPKDKCMVNSQHLEGVWKRYGTGQWESVSLIWPFSKGILLIRLVSLIPFLSKDYPAFQFPNCSYCKWLWVGFLNLP